MFKNVAAKFIVFAFDTTTNTAKTGDAANLTAYVSKDYGTVTVLADTSATEMDSTNAKGYYLFDAAQGETNGDVLLITAKSTTANIAVIGAPAVIFTRPTTGWLAPTVAARTLDVSATGEAGVDWGNVGSPTTTVDLSGTTIKTTQKVDVDTIKTNPVVNAGTVTFPTTATLASTTNITAATGVDITKILGTTIATPATAGILDVNVKNIDNDAASASGTVTFPNATLASTTNITAGTITTATNLTTNNDKTGYGLSSAAVQAIWDALTSALTTVGSIGKLIVTNLDALISSRMATYTQPTGFLAATFPSGTVANTTNITAGTVTTATNVTTVNGLAAGVITDTSIAADAITAAKLAADVATEIQAGLATSAALATVQADTDDIQSRLPAALTAGGKIKASMDEILAVGQSATDLKDFADDGYDPATNKVQGVVLTDTVTTYTGNTPQTGDVFPLASTEIADIKAKTDNLPSDPADASVVAGLIAAVEAKVDIIDGIVDSILVDTTEIGVAGAGLTNINLPDQTMDITGSLSGSVGSVTGNVGGNVVGTIGGLTGAALKDFFDTDTTAVFGDAVAGSVVKEIADNSGGSSLTVQDIVDGVWDEPIADHLDAGSTGEALSDAGGAGTPPTAAEVADAVWDEDATGHQTTGTFGQAIGDPVSDTNTIYKAVVTDAAGATVGVDVVAVQADTDNIQTRLPAALTGGKMESNIGSVTAGVIAATSFAANALDAVWSTAVRLLTAGTNIVLAKGTGVTGFNDLSAAQVNAEADTALADYDGPTHAEMTAELATSDDAVLAAIAALNNLAPGAAMTLTAGERNAIADAYLARSLGTEAVSADGAVPTVAQAFFEMLSLLGEFEISGDTITCKKRDGATTLFTSTLDSASAPTARTRTT